MTKEAEAKFDWLAASPRERDAWLAVHLMGWIPATSNWWLPQHGGKFNCTVEEADRWLFEYDGGLAWEGKQYCSRHRHDWQPTSDIKNAFHMEEAIRERGLVFDYVHYLVRVLHTKLIKLDVQDDRADIFAIAHASPEQRGHAAYLALTGRTA